MINEILTWLLLASPLIWESITDIREYKKGKRDDKKKDVYVRGGIALGASWLVSLLNPNVTILQALALSIGIFVMFFDYIVAYGMTKRLTFLGTTAKTDGLWARIGPLGGLLWRSIIFATCLIVYYDLDKVIHGVQY